MIRCPKCGSTAQVKVVWNDPDTHTSNRYTEYKCGCGCHFMITFREVETRIIKK